MILYMYDVDFSMNGLLLKIEQNNSKSKLQFERYEFEKSVFLISQNQKPPLLEPKPAKSRPKKFHQKPPQF